MTGGARVGLRDVTIDQHVVRILTFRRPEQRNPIDLATLEELAPLLDTAADDERVRIVVVTGEGSAFSAGGDLRGYLHLYAELALACDLVIAADDARIADGHLVVGQLPGAGGSQRLCRAIGLQKAKELLLTGRTVTAAEAVAIGLVAEVVPAAELEARVIEVAAAAARHSRLGVQRMKELIALSQDNDRATALRAEIDLVVDYATTTHDATEGLHAFLERRPPDWQGR